MSNTINPNTGLPLQESTPPADISKRIANNTVTTSDARKAELSRAQAVQAAIEDIFKKRQDTLAAALGKAFTPEFFMSFVLNAMRTNPKLQEAAMSKPGQASLFAAAMKCASLRLIPNTDLGQIYLIPYKKKDPETGQHYMSVEAQIGRNGMVGVVMRSPGQIRAVDAWAVYVDDTFTYDRVTGEMAYTPKTPRKRDQHGRFPVKAAVAKLEWQTGGRAFVVLDSDDIDRIKRSVEKKNFGKLSPAWVEFEDRMVERSAMVRLLRVYGGATANADLTQALHHEMTSELGRAELFTEEDASGALIDNETGEVLGAPEQEPGSDG